MGEADYDVDDSDDDDEKEGSSAGAEEGKAKDLSNKMRELSIKDADGDVERMD